MNQRVRRERKFIAKRPCDARDVLYILAFCTPGLRRHYEDRHVNNVYFDTSGAQTAQDNLAGVRNRKKYRVRWYGDMFQQRCEGWLEEKLRQAGNGAKVRSALRPFEFTRDCDLRRILRGRVGDPRGCEFSFLVPMLVNRYQRSYFRTRDEKLRVTIDRDLSFWRPLWGFGVGIQNPIVSENVIVELKYSPKDEALARAFMGRVPLRLSKSSKYVQGMLFW